MRLRDFIKNNRAELDEYIRGFCSNIASLNDDEREQWILNEEGLYRWARSEGWRG